MKFLVVLAVAVAVASADVSHVVRGVDADAPIVRSSYDSSPDGTSYNFAFETGNKIVTNAEGVVKNLNSETPIHEVRGAYSYISLDGTPIDTTYIANENGYQPAGSHLPVPPPIPDAILRALDYIERHPQPVERKL